jgi:DNA processing protein
MSPLEALVTLNFLPKIGPIRVRRLLEVFGDPASILAASADRLLRVDGIGEETVGILRNWQDHADPVAEIANATARGITIVPQDHESYPAPLRNAYDPPLLLYVWGEIQARDRHAIGMVGSRRATPYGRQATQKFSSRLATAGFTILSGLARGIDTTAHEAALEAGGRTIAVLGSGLARLYPPENLSLAENIAAGKGAVVSEFPLETAPDKQTFPMRNRIVAAWAQAVLVVECPEWSGSLITANLASEYGKPVMEADHILEDLGELPLGHAPRSTPQVAPAVVDLPADEALVFSKLDAGESAVDQIVEATGLPASTVTATLMKLELRRLVRAMPGFRYVRR